MLPSVIPIRTADDQFEFGVDTPEMAQSLARSLRDLDLTEEVVAGLESVSVRFHPRHAAEIQARLEQNTKIKFAADKPGKPLEIGIRYGGEYGFDLAHVCAALALSEEAFIAMHTECDHTVAMIGFTPGFAYVSGLPSGISIPRLSQPRSRVAAGSVGISADFTGLYALAGPGGWPLIGRTDTELFSPDHQDPFRLQPGQRVKFRAI